jgi:hypothetical protein
MGARRFGPSTGRFQQPDVYFGALSNLGLSVDPLTQNRYSLAGTNPVSFMELDGHMVLPDGSGGSATAPSVIGAAAAPQPYQEPAPEPEPEPNVLQKAWNNTKDFVGGGASGAIDAGKGVYQLGYDTFYGASPFADEQTQAETKARAQARGELIKDPSKLIDAVKAPYQQDIATGHDGRAAGRAVFDILTIIGTGSAGATAKTGTAARAAGGASRAAAPNSALAKFPKAARESPKPPGFDPNTYQWREASRSIPENHWWDPSGGEWRHHPADKWHDPHWDYNPWTEWNSPWQHIYPEEPPG